MPLFTEHKEQAEDAFKRTTAGKKLAADRKAANKAEGKEDTEGDEGGLALITEADWNPEGKIVNQSCCRPSPSGRICFEAGNREYDCVPLAYF